MADQTTLMDAVEQRGPYAVWGLMDEYLFPENYQLSLWVSLFLGLGKTFHLFLEGGVFAAQFINFLFIRLSLFFLLNFHVGNRLAQIGNDLR